MRVTVRDIEHVARAWLQPDNLSMVLMGGVGGRSGATCPVLGFDRIEVSRLSELDRSAADLRRSGDAVERSGRRPASRTPSIAHWSRARTVRPDVFVAVGICRPGRGARAVPAVPGARAGGSRERHPHPAEHRLPGVSGLRPEIFTDDRRKGLTPARCRDMMVESQQIRHVQSTSGCPPNTTSRQRKQAES